MRKDRSFVKKEKPTTFYHMQLVDHVTNHGWRVAKHDTFQNEKGSFLRKDGQTIFIGWSGRVILEI